MNEPKCRSCLFYDICTSHIGCDNYTPAGEQAEEEFLDTYIEDRRTEFAADWQAYFADELD